MGQAANLPISTPDPAEVAGVLNEIAAAGKSILAHKLKNTMNNGALGSSELPVNDDLGIAPAFANAKLNLLLDPFHLAEQQIKYMQDASRLWQSTWMGLWGLKSDPVIEPDRGDHRFKDELWEDHPMYDFIKQSYLITARCLYSTLTGVKGLDDQKQAKVDFFTRQFIDALAPTNFLITNPAAQREFIGSGGLSVLKGLRNLLKDIEKGNGQLKISMTDQDAFELGKNVAVTPGKVVYQNDMMQLLQYNPSTEQVLKRPLLIVPPWINKFYILDLREKNSLIKWAVDQGHTVFVVSWVNPDETYAEKGFDDYVLDGIVAATDAIEQATGEKEINAIGYCLGGTLLATTLAYMASKRDSRIKSATFFATMMDFACPGELGIFIDEEQLASLEKRLERGYLDGSEMASTFNMLRANDLIWSFVVNNYLLGKEPFPFDLLYWNSDSTRMPANMHKFYLWNMYQKNLLREPGGLTIAGTPINLSKVKVPTYFLATIEDHIAPWKSTYAGTQLLSGKNRFVLAGSGHIAGVINPPNPDRPKYGYLVNEQLPASPEEWYEGAAKQEGSWWPNWQEWVSSLNDAKVPARTPGDGALTVIEDAPGSYVKKRIA